MAKKSDSPLTGILLIDKPAGWTSHDVVARVRRLTGQRRIGHTGTLDPAATGLLVLCLGQATRFVEYITAHDKCYTGVVTPGVRTATDDAEGEVLERRPVPALDSGVLRALEARYTGTIMQRPPAYSAVSVDGERAYAVARRGGELFLAARPVTIHHLKLVPTAEDVLSIEVQCGPGTYIRSIARDIGETLGCGAHLSGLRRTRSGPFDVADAFTLADVEVATRAGEVAQILRPADDGISEFDAAIVASHGLAELGFGRLYRASDAPGRDVPVARIYGVDGTFRGVASVSSSGEIRPLKLLDLANSAQTDTYVDYKLNFGIDTEASRSDHA